eukprot:1643151-Prymnesium_polylepis.1
MNRSIGIGSTNRISPSSRAPSPSAVNALNRSSHRARHAVADCAECAAGHSAVQWRAPPPPPPMAVQHVRQQGTGAPRS